MSELTEQQKANIAADEERRKREKTTVYWEDAENIDDAPMAGRCWRFTIDPVTGYHYDGDEIHIRVGADGSIHFFDKSAEHFTYFYPDQLKYLERALKAAKAAKRSTAEER